MKNILTIIKKELLRVFKDPKLIVVVLLLPGILIFALYNIMGIAMESGSSSNEPLKIYTVNMPDEIETIFNTEEYEIILEGTFDENKEKLTDKEIDLVLVFEVDFFDKIAQGEIPDINIFYNSASAKSAQGYQKIAEVLTASVFTIKAESVADIKSSTGQIFAMMVPVVLISLLFSGCMSVAPDSIAGEKERGTMATLLKTPVKRREIAIGKITALSILAVINAISSFIGLMLSIPKLTGLSGASGLYGFNEYALILLVIISTVLIIISVMSVISCFAKTVKEASMLIMPFMLLSLVIGVTSMISQAAVTGFYFYLIPLYNSVQCLTAILTFNINWVNLIITVVSNIVYMGIFVFVLSKLFNKEKIMFAK